MTSDPSFDSVPETDGNGNRSLASRQTDSEPLYLSSIDERANVMTHGLGFVASLGAAAFFLQESSRTTLGLHLTTLAFCVALVTVYCFSTLSHAIEQPGLRNRLRAWDQGTIYFLIVGTYSPFIWQGSSGTFRTILLVSVWSAAALGFWAKVFAGHRVNSVATITYLLLGWLPAIPLFPNTPRICFVWMLLGGLAYSLGIPFLKMSDRVRFSHAVWHMMVIAGSACHGYAIYILLRIASAQG